MYKYLQMNFPSLPKLCERPSINSYVHVYVEEVVKKKKKKGKEAVVGKMKRRCTRQRQRRRKITVHVPASDFLAS